MSWMKWIGRDESSDLERLMDVFVSCHQRAAVENDNASAVAIRMTASVGGSFSNSVASGLLTFGNVHGPAPEARWLLYSAEGETLESYLKTVLVIPGWGNSFHKDGVAPAFQPMTDLILNEYSDHYKNLERMQGLIEEHRGKKLYQNAASYTAICAELLGLPAGTELMLGISARMPAWAAIWARQRQELFQ